jgi:hypothetical protein
MMVRMIRKPRHGKGTGQFRTGIYRRNRFRIKCNSQGDTNPFLPSNTNRFRPCLSQAWATPGSVCLQIHFFSLCCVQYTVHIHTPQLRKPVSSSRGGGVLIKLLWACLLYRLMPVFFPQDPRNSRCMTASHACVRSAVYNWCFCVHRGEAEASRRQVASSTPPPLPPITPHLGAPPPPHTPPPHSIFPQTFGVLCKYFQGCFFHIFEIE